MHLHHVLFLGGLSIAASVAHAQSPVFGRLYDAQDRVLLTLPAPLPSGHFASKGVRDAVGSVAPSYIRLYASTLANATDKALDTPPVKPHEEVRSDNLIKIVVWTHERLLEPTAEILTRAMQRYLASAVQLQASQGRAQPANGMQLNLDQLALDKATVMEIELMGVEESQLIRHPFCRRTTGGNEDPTFVGRDAPLPCPSLVLADQMYLAKWAQNEMLRPLDAIFGRLAFNPLTDIADPGKYNLRFNAAWHGAPLFLDTRVLAYNRTTLTALKLKLPPPAGDWGSPYHRQWTFDVMVDYAKRVTAAGLGDGFNFQAGWDEENMLIPMIARAYGAQIMRPNGLSAINSTEFRTAINRTILQLWSENRPSANRQFVPNNAEFQQWQAEPLADPFALQPTFCCQQASPFGPGMAIVSPVQVGSGIGDIQVGYVPTDAGYFGATAFSLLRGSLNPSFALSMVSYILSPDNTYSADIAAIPPFNDLQNAAPFNGAAYRTVTTQLANSKPFREPLPFMPFTLDFVDRKPFRLFLMELAFKSVPLDTAIDRTAALLDIISLPSCVNATLPLSVDRCTVASAFERFAVDSTASLLGGNGTCKVEVDREVVGDLECTFVALESTPAYASFGIGGVAAFAFIIMSVLVVTRGSSISTGSGDSVGRLLMLMGAVMIAIAGILSLGSPSIEMCTARTWSLVVGFTLAFGLLLGRISSNYGSSIASTPAAGVFVVNIGLLLLWTFFPSMPQEGSMSTVVGEFERGSAVDIQMPSCSTGSIPVLITLVAVNGVLALVGLLVSLSKASQEFVVTMRSQYRSSAAAFFFALAGIVIATSLVMFLPDVSERTRVMIISFTALIVGLLALFFIGRVVVKRVGEVKPRGADGMYVTYGHMTDSQQRLKIVAGDNGRKSTTSSTFGLSRNDPAALNRFIPTESPRDSKEKAVGSAGRIIDDRDSNKAASDIDTKSAFRRPLTLADEMQGGSNDDFASRFSGVTLFTNKPGAFATGVDDDETVDEEREVMEAIPSPPPPLVARNTMAAPVEVEIPMPATDLDDDLPVDGDRIGTPLDGDDALIPPVQLFQHRQSAYQSMYSDGMLGDGFDSTADAASRRSTMMPSDAVSSMEEGGEMEESAEDIIASIEQSMRMRFDVGAEGSDAGGKRDVTAVAANVDDGRRESTMSSRLLAFSNGLQQARNSKDVPRQNM